MQQPAPSSSSPQQSAPAGHFTGYHMAGILVAFFGVVVAVNLYMARMASSSFGGVVVDNSYVASQKYNRWLEQAAAEKALGWSAQVARMADGRVMIALAGPGTAQAQVAAIARHPLGTRPDAALRFVRQADGRFLSQQRLADDRWQLRITARRGDDLWRKEIPLR